MKKKPNKQRPNQKQKRVSANTNKGFRYKMTSRGLQPILWVLPTWLLRSLT